MSFETINININKQTNTGNKKLKGTKIFSCVPWNHAWHCQEKRILRLHMRNMLNKQVSVEQWFPNHSLWATSSDWIRQGEHGRSLPSPYYLMRAFTHRPLIQRLGKTLSRSIVNNSFCPRKFTVQKKEHAVIHNRVYDAIVPDPNSKNS